MNKIYCIGSIYNQIDKLDNFIKRCDNSDVIYILGNFSVCSSQQQSQITYIYLYNLIQQKINNPDIIPSIKLIKGKNESSNNIKLRDFNQLIIDSGYKYIKNQYPNSLFDITITKPDGKTLFNFINDLELFIKINNLILVSGYYSLHLNIIEQLNQANINLISGLLYGSIAKVNLYYYEFCKINKYRLWSKQSRELFLNNDINFDHYKTIDEYNDDLKKENLIVVCGNWYDPNFKKDLGVSSWSNLYMIDGGLNRSLNNEKQWFYYALEEEKFNVLDVSDTNNINFFNFN